jgi:hypothetical protein
MSAGAVRRGAAAVLVGLLIQAPAAAQRPARERPVLAVQPAVAFPPAVTAAFGISTFGARAERTETLVTDGTIHDYSFSLVKGLTLAARVQSPLGRQFGLMLAGSAAYRSRDVRRDGEPFIASESKILSLRGEAGLLFRFKPAAPIFFGASFVYQTHRPAPVEGQEVSRATESGGGIGIGYEFERRANSSMSARIEMWNYWVSPTGAGILPPLRKTGSAHDFVLTLGITRRLNPGRRRG